MLHINVLMVIAELNQQIAQHQLHALKNFQLNAQMELAKNQKNTAKS